MTIGLKRRGGLLLLVLVLAILAAYVWLIDLPREQAAQKAAEQTDKLLSSDPTAASALVLVNGDSTIRLFKDASERWSLTSPVATPADQAAIRTLLARLSEARRLRVIDESPADLSPYGLAPARLVVTYTVNGLDTRVEFGGNNPVGSFTYVRLLPVELSAARPRLPDGQGQAGVEPGASASAAHIHPVVLIPVEVKEAVDKTLFDLRKKELFDLSADQLTALKLLYANQPGQPIRLERHSGGSIGPKAPGRSGAWELTAPLHEKADQEVVGALAAKLSGLRATSIMDEGKTAKLASLPPPRMTISLSTGEPATQVRIYLPFSEEAAYAVTTPDAPLYQVSRQVVLQLEKSLFDLQDKHVVPIDPEAVQAIEVAAPNRAYRLTKRGDVWVVNDETLSPDGSQTVNAFLKQLSKARVEKIAGRNAAAWPGLGLASTAITVSLIGADAASAPPAVVRFGKTEGELMYVRRGEAPESYIMEAALGEALPTPEKLRGVAQEGGHPKSGEAGKH
jgi:hypothetical protein